MKRTTDTIAASILLLLCAVLPFVFYTGPGSFTLPRAVLLQAGAAAAALVLLIGKPRTRFAAPALLGAWLFIMALCATVSPWPLAGLKTLVLFATCAVLACCAAAVFHEEKGLAALCTAVVGAGAIMALHGIAQSHGPVLHALTPLRGRFTIIATAGSPAMLAGWLAPGLCLALAMSLRARTPAIRTFARLAFAAMTLCLFLCMSRSGWAAAAAGLAVMLAAIGFTGAARLRSASVTLAVCLLLALSLAGAREIAARSALIKTQAPPAATVLEQATRSMHKQDSIRLRLFALDAARRMIARSPVLGNGPDGFRMLYPETQADMLKNEGTRARLGTVLTNRLATHAHNEFVESAVEVGVIGALIFLVLLFTGLRHLMRRIGASGGAGERVLLCGALGALTAMLVQAGLEYTLHLPLCAALFWLLFGAACSCETPIQTSALEKVSVKALRAAGVAAAVTLLLTAPLPWLAVRDMAKGVELAEKGHFEEASDALDRAARLDPMNPDILHSRAGVNLSLGRAGSAVADLDRGLGLSRSPSLFIARGIALRMAGEPGRAASDFRVAADVDPWRPEPWYHLAALARSQGDSRLARTHCLRALELSPDFRPARLLLRDLDARNAESGSVSQ